MEKINSLRLALATLTLAFVLADSASAIGPLPATTRADLNADDKICVSGLCDSGKFSCLYNKAIYEERWDTLPQTLFWRKIMHTSPDSGYFSTSGSRRLLLKFSTTTWGKMNTKSRMELIDSLQSSYCLDSETTILFTPGKSDFYKISPVLASIDKAVRIFEQEATDPFYAQAIILIESPGRLQKSTVGAYGAFQLMRSVAIRMGLKVNRTVDERKDFNKSAWAAAKLLRTICIPETKAILDRNGIAYNEHDLWFRLLVLHVYHAGAGNVAPIIDRICPISGNKELIRKVWQTSYGAFRNSSQNYSQLALASLIELDELIFNECNDPAF